MSNLSDSLPDTGLTSAEKSAMALAIEKKLQSIVGRSSGYIESLPPKVQARITALKDIQSEYDTLESQFLEEKAALERKYLELYEPLYSKRSDIVSGATEPIKAAEADGTENDPKGIPEFWLTVLKNSEIIEEQITDKDKGALVYLKDIKSSLLPDGQKGFKLDFYFDENPYFTNTVLSKSYIMVDEEDHVLERAIGTPIEWKAGKNLTQRTLRKKPKKGSSENKIVTKTEDCPSFFTFFSPPEVPDDDAELDEDEGDQLQEQMEADYEIGITIKEKLIPNAVLWFTGEAVDLDALEDGWEDESDEEDADDEDDDDEDDDDEDDEEDEDEDNNEKKKLKKASKKMVKAKGGDGEKPAECKQQ